MYHLILGLTTALLDRQKKNRSTGGYHAYHEPYVRLYVFIFKQFCCRQQDLDGLISSNRNKVTLIYIRRRKNHYACIHFKEVYAKQRPFHLQFLFIVLWSFQAHYISHYIVIIVILFIAHSVSFMVVFEKILFHKQSYIQSFRKILQISLI